MFGSVLLMGSFASCIYCSSSSSKDFSCLQCQFTGLGSIFGNLGRLLVYGFHDVFRKKALFDLRSLGGNGGELGDFTVPLLLIVVN